MTDIKNADTPASPTQYQDSCNGELYSDNTGLTKREAFAMEAMQGLCANQYFVADRDSSYKEIASNAKFMADALLEELSK